MSFYHGPGDHGGCFSSKGHTFHFAHGPKRTARNLHGSGLDTMLSWCFDRGLEVAWRSWPLQIYVRFRTMWGKAIQTPRKFRSPILVSITSQRKIREKLRKNYWETNGFGFDTLARKKYLVAEALKLGVTPDNLLDWKYWKEPLTYPITYEDKHGNIVSDEVLIEKRN